MPRARFAAALFVAAVWAAPLHAQLDGFVDAGGARLRQVGLPRTDVFSLGGRLRWQGLRASLMSAASMANTPDGAWTAQGLISGSVYAAPLQPRRWELGAALSGFDASSARATSSGQLLVREHFALGSRAGWFVGAQGGGIVRDAGWRHAAAVQTGLWRRARAQVFSGAVSVTDTKTELLLLVPPENPGAPYGEYRERHPATYVDALGFWEVGRDRLDIEIGGGVRAGLRGVERSTVWGSASATFWFLPRLGLVASTGRALEDVVRGLPQTRYLSLSLRVGVAGPPRVAMRRAKLDDDAPRLAVTRHAEEVELAVRVREAQRVEIMGDFTAWEPLALVQSGDVWLTRRTIQAGSHRVALRIDGGAWQAPANLPKVTDDFGGVVGLVSIP